MRAFLPYLMFDGTAREAMTFYKHCLGESAVLAIQTFGDVKSGDASMADRVMHAQITGGTMNLMASDSMTQQSVRVGNNVCISQDCESLEEIERLFAAFGEGGNVTMPLANQFWGARFGMLTDKFGINWMFNCEHAK